jgi:hypothetical protein
MRYIWCLYCYGCWVIFKIFALFAVEITCIDPKFYYEALVAFILLVFVILVFT